MGNEIEADAETIAVYDERGDDYARMVEGAAQTPGLTSFMELVTPNGTVLDLGCGPGGTSAILRDRGFAVTAVDASSQMIKLAGGIGGITVRQASFEDAFPASAYDGIWASFSLLHAPRARLPVLIGKFAGCLRDGGIFHIGMKTAMKDRHGEGRDKLGRYYAYYSRDELLAMFAACGLPLVREFAGEGSGLSGETSQWIEIQARKIV